MCYICWMENRVGLRELRQNASGVVRRIEAGESVLVTVNGRPAARLVPVGGRRWRRWDEVADVLGGPGAPGLVDDLATLDGSVTDPFDERP